jgi:hypothetical protein
MDNKNLGTRVLPGVDLTLWVRLVMFMVLAAIAVGIVTAFA